MVLEPQVRPVFQGVVDHRTLPDPAHSRAKCPWRHAQSHPEAERVQSQLLARMPGPGSALPELAPHLGVPSGIRPLGRRRGAERPGLRETVRAHSGKILPGRTQSNRSHRARGGARRPSERTPLGLAGDFHASPSPTTAHPEGSEGLGDVQGGEVFAVDVRRGQIPPSQGHARSGGGERMPPESGKIHSLQAQGPGPSRSGLHTGGLRRQGGVPFQRVAFARPGGIGAAATDDCRRWKGSVEGPVQADQRGDR